MDDMITQDAAEIFDTGYYDECPDKHSYMNLQYGMRALYIKYCAKTVNLAFELRLQLNGWYFNQTIDPTPQFKEQNDTIVALHDMDLAENSKIFALNFMLMLQKNSLYEPVVVELSNSVAPEDAFFDKVSYEDMKQKCKTFYGGVLVVKLKLASPSQLKTLQQESLNWNMTTESHAQQETINSVETSALLQTVNAIKELQQEVKTLKFSSNKRDGENGNKKLCTICGRVHAGKCTFTDADFCQSDACKGKGMKLKGKRHVIGCDHFNAEEKNGHYCHICGKPGISADKHTADCKEKLEYYR